jgi:precorrin-2 dehydrogenase/sirohydrochlorin ferrochelatase
MFRGSAGAARVLIAGGGKVASRKLQGLPRSWKVTVVSPRILNSMKARAFWVRRGARITDVDAHDIIFAATNDLKLNARLAKRALKKGRLVCVVDQPGLGNFTVPAVVKAGRLSATLSTSGSSPALAKALRLWLKGRLSRPHLQKLVNQLGNGRAAFKKDPKAKAAALSQLGRPGFLERMLR